MSEARAIWHRIETIHAVTYFADESRQAAQDAGLKGFWMGYFGFRAAPMGPVDAGIVTSGFANFAPAMVARAIPDAWDHARPADLVDIRRDAAAAALGRLAPGVGETSISANPLLTAVASVAEPAGRLSEANLALPAVPDPIAQLWQLVTTMREHRGDHHVRLLREAGVDGCESHQLHAAEHDTPHDLLRASRGWSEREWADAAARLADRELVVEGRLTAQGRALRRDVEDETDRHAARPFDAALDEADRSRLLGLLDGPARAVAHSGVIPYPNPMGLPTLPPPAP